MQTNSQLIIKLLIFFNFIHVFKQIISPKLSVFLKKIIDYEFLQFNP
jgi:hypothetical protein